MGPVSHAFDWQLLPSNDVAWQPFTHAEDRDGVTTGTSACPPCGVSRWSKTNQGAPTPGHGFAVAWGVCGEPVHLLHVDCCPAQ